MAPEWLLQALTIVVGIIGSGAVWYFLSQGRPHKALWVGWSGAVLLLLVVTLYIRNDLIRKEGASTTLQEPTFRENPTKVFFIVGGNTFAYDAEALRKGSKVPLLGGYSPITVYLEGNRLYADFEMYAGVGHSPVEIKHNQFVVRLPQWDRNSNQSAFEVVNESLVPVFQLIYDGPNKIRINGIFPMPTGIMLASESGTVFNPLPGQMATFTRIFKYPSWKYPGQYEAGSAH